MKKGFALIFVFLLFASIFFVSFVSADFFGSWFDENSGIKITGQATGNAVASTCVDSDNGKNYFVKGTTSGIDARTGSQTSQTDRCADAKTLIEYFCNNDGKVASFFNSCASGCASGICKGTAPTPTTTVPSTTQPSTTSVQQPTTSTQPSATQLTPQIGNIQQNQNTLFPKQITVSSDGRTIYQQGNVLTPSGNILTNQQSMQQFSGYIVELKEEPLVVKNNKLKQEAKINQAEGLRVSPRTSISRQATLPSNVNAKLQLQKTRVQNEHSSFRTKAAAKISAGGTTNAFLSLLTGKATSTADLKILREYNKAFNGFAMNITQQQAESLKTLSEVKTVTPNYKVNISLSDSIPLINADDVWQLDSQGNDCATSGQDCLTGKGITIGIIDTGVDYTHFDLGSCAQTININDGSCSKVIGGYDFVNNDNDPMDDHGHGTHVAATAAGNGILKGVAPDAKIFGYKVLNQDGSGYWDDIIAAIERSVDPNQDGNFSDHLDIISLSLGGPGNPDDPISLAIDNAVDLGVVAVIAAGNSGPSFGTIGSPGTARKAITIGAVYNKNYEGTFWPLKNGGDTNPRKDQITVFSSRGHVSWIDSQGNKKYLIKPDVIAPGSFICAARYDSIFPDGEHPYYYPCVDDKHVLMAGTSMATPIVSGSIALIKQAHPDWTPIEIKMALRSTAVDINEPFYAQGYGRIDVLEVVKSNKPPLAILEDGKEVSGIIDIRGTAKSDNFASYSLYYGEGTNPSSWTEIATRNTPIENGILFSGFDTSQLNEWEYTIKLVVRNSNGGESEDKMIINVNNIEIALPSDNSIIPQKDNHSIDVTGTVYERNLQQFEILLDGISSSRITLTDDGKNSILKGLLARLDTSNFETGFHNLKLRVFLSSGDTHEFVSVFYFDPFLNKNSLKKMGSEVYTPSPVFGDINNDGKDEIAFRDYSGNIHILDSSGNSLLGWPKKLENFPCGWLCPTTVSLADLNGDNSLEMVIQSVDGEEYGNFGGVSTNYLLIYSFATGETKKILFDTQGIATAAPVIADLDKDEKEDIIASFFNGDLSILDNNGNLITKYTPSEGLYLAYDPPIVGNFDDDSDLEITFVTQSFENGRYLNVINKDGSFVNGWPVHFLDQSSDNPYKVGSNFLISADLDKDGKDEIILSYEDGLSVYNHDGTVKNGWPQKQPDGYYSPVKIAVGDLNKDNKLDIFYLFFYPKAYNTDGTELISPAYRARNYKRINDGFEVFSYREGYPILTGDEVFFIDKDTEEVEIIPQGTSLAPLVNYNFIGGTLYHLRNQEDNSFSQDEIKPLKYQRIDFSMNYEGSPIIGDFDKDGKTDLFLVDSNGTDYLWNFGTPYNPSKMDWPMFQHDPQHTGCYDCDEISTTSRTGSIKTCEQTRTLTRRTIGENQCGSDETKITLRSSYRSCSGPFYRRTCRNYEDYSCVKTTTTECSATAACPTGTIEKSSESCTLISPVAGIQKTCTQTRTLTRQTSKNRCAAAETVDSATMRAYSECTRKVFKTCLRRQTYYDYNCVKTTTTACSANAVCPTGAKEISSAAC